MSLQARRTVKYRASRGASLPYVLLRLASRRISFYIFRFTSFPQTCSIVCLSLCKGAVWKRVGALTELYCYCMCGVEWIQSECSSITQSSKKRGRLACGSFIYPFSPYICLFRQAIKQVLGTMFALWKTRDFTLQVSGDDEREYLWSKRGSWVIDWRGEPYIIC